MAMETPALAELLEPVGRCLSREGAKRLVGLRATAPVQSRIEELAEKSNSGELTQGEVAEYETLVSAGTFIAVLQAQARQLLKDDELS